MNIKHILNGNGYSVNNMNTNEIIWDIVQLTGCEYTEYP